MVTLINCTILGTNVDGAFPPLEFQRLYDSDFFDYKSYNWFIEKYSNFLYIDQIVIEGKFLNQGLGTYLYQNAFEHAKRTGVETVTAAITEDNEASISKMKTGKISAIRFSTLEAICEALNCQPGDILEYKHDEQGDTSKDAQN